jgi:hypothetical protein
MTVQHQPPSLVSLAVFHGRSILVAAVIRGFYDGSGQLTHGGRFLSLAGYAATPEAWKAFEERWETVLKKHGAPFLHMKELKQLRGPYEGWTEQQAQALLVDLMNDALSPIGRGDYFGQFVGASCSVNLVDYTRLVAEMPAVLKHWPAATFCVNHVADIAIRMLPEDHSQPFGKAGSLELFFDVNETFLHHVEQPWRECTRNPKRWPGCIHHKMSIVAPVSQEFRPRGIEAADWLVWHRNLFRVSSVEIANLDTILTAPDYDRLYTYKELREYVEKKVSSGFVL